MALQKNYGYLRDLSEGVTRIYNINMNLKQPTVSLFRHEHIQPKYKWSGRKRGGDETLCESQKTGRLISSGNKNQKLGTKIPIELPRWEIPIIAKNMQIKQIRYNLKREAQNQIYYNFD